MGSVPVIGVAAVAATVGILFLILFDFVRVVWLALPVWVKLGLACIMAFVSIVAIASAS